MAPISTDDHKTKLYTRPYLFMAFSNFFAVAGLSAFLLFPLFIRNAGGNESDIGLQMGAMSLAAVIFRPWTSNLVDRLGRKRTYWVGCLMLAMLPPVYGLFQGNLQHVWPELFLLRILHGVADGLVFVAGFTYIADIIPSQRMSEGLGMFGIFGLTGSAAGPVLGEFAIRWAGFTGLYGYAGLLGLMALILQIPLKESFRPEPTRDKGSFLTVLKRKKTGRIALLAVLCGMGSAAYQGFVAPYAESRGIGFVSLFFVGYSVAAVLVRPFGGRLADRVGEERILPLALLVIGGGYLMLVDLEGSGRLLLSGMVTGVGQGLVFPCFLALALRNEPIGDRGKINGAFTGGLDLGLFGGSLLLGWIGQRAGYGPLFLMAGAFVWAGLLYFLARILPLVSKRSVNPPLDSL